MRAWAAAWSRGRSVLARAVAASFHPQGTEQGCSSRRGSQRRCSPGSRRAGPVDGRQGRAAGPVADRHQGRLAVRPGDDVDHQRPDLTAVDELPELKPAAGPETAATPASWPGRGSLQKKFRGRVVEISDLALRFTYRPLLRGPRAGLQVQGRTHRLHFSANEATAERDPPLRCSEASPGMPPGCFLSGDSRAAASSRPRNSAPGSQMSGRAALPRERSAVRLVLRDRPILPIPLHLPLGSRFMSKKRKRISRRRLAGQRVLAHVPTYNLETGEHKPVTAARRYIAETGLELPHCSTSAATSTPPIVSSGVRRACSAPSTPRRTTSSSPPCA